ncbi:recombinase family protein [Bdellovibrio sp. 22V]|uniref:recombinase family protein n=1 Tax=Bdellovibrio sp. 22V TaxID=3044166 RepID=UPI0025439CA4|nr:recombinase family protein [Bdellovibrio sp. 22V]WII72155.1 recombinase family protein [Bdellovibrio sp. 22V]
MEKKKVILYARVSLIDLNLQNQLLPLRRQCELRDYQIVGEFADHGSGKIADRPQLRKALAAMKSLNADVLMVAALDRLGRSLSHIIKLVDNLRKDGKGIFIVRENLDLSGKNPQSELLLHIFSALAEFEASLISERTKVALAVAKLQGKTLGRPSKVNPEIEKQVLELFSKGTPIREISRRVTTVSRSTVQAIIKRNKRSCKIRET